MARKTPKKVCQVCGQPVTGNNRNCGIHSYVSERMTLLAQDIWRMESSVDADMIASLAEKHQCSTSTVRNHFKRQGYVAKRKWNQKGVR